MPQDDVIFRDYVPFGSGRVAQGVSWMEVVRSLFGVTIMLHLHSPVTVTSHPRLEPLVVELSPAEHRGRCSENTCRVDGKTEKLPLRQVSLFLSFSVAAFLLHSLSLCKCVCWGCVCHMPAFWFSLFSFSFWLSVSWSLLRSLWLGLYCSRHLSLSCCLSVSFILLSSLPHQLICRTQACSFFLSLLLLLLCWLARAGRRCLDRLAPRLQRLSFQLAVCDSVPRGLQYLIWNLVRKLPIHIFTFWGTFLACRMGSVQADIFPVRCCVCQKLYYENNHFCLSILPGCSPVLMYFHLFSVGLSFRVLAFWISGKAQNNTEERNGKTSG